MRDELPPPWEIPAAAYENDAPVVVPINGHIKRTPEPEAGAPPCPPIDWSTLDGAPPERVWWIPGWLGPWPSLTAGGGGAGKTRLWHTVGTALATSRRYLDEPVAPLKVLMWLCEDDRDEIWRQQVAINAHLDLTMADLKDRLYVVPRHGQENTLLDLAFGRAVFTPLLKQLREQVNDFKADVLVLDNIAQVFGGNENDRHQATYFVNGIAGLVSGRPFAPVLLGHTARAQGSEFSGSAAWENAVRMRWYVGPTLPDQKVDEDEELDPDVVYLARRKANYCAKDYRKLKFENGVLVPEQQEEGRRFDQIFRNEAAERVVMSGLAKLRAVGLSPTDGRTAADYLPTQIIAKGYAENHSKNELTSAMNRLMGAGRLKRDVVGSYSNRNPRYGLVAV